MTRTRRSQAPVQAPRQVLLFSGHRVDAPQRAHARFPASMEALAARRIGELLDRLAAGRADLALSQAAAGGDLLFLEACRRRRVGCEVLLPCDEGRFVQHSISDGPQGADWLARWQALRPSLRVPPRVMPATPGEPALDGALYERCNVWLLDTAVARGAGRLQVICLWDGGEGDGPGGTSHLVQLARHRGCTLHWIDTGRLDQGE